MDKILADNSNKKLKYETDFHPVLNKLLKDLEQGKPLD